MSWREMKLGDVLTLKRGYDLPTSQRKDGAIPVVSSSGITGSHNTSKVAGPGVVTGRYGTLGEVFYIENDFWPLNTALYVQDFKENNRRFIAYFLRSILRNVASDKAAVPGVNRNDLHAKDILFPDSKTQNRITDILSTYDDLIENNRRRIQLLEESARLLYREWFVHLRFPGHEHVKIVDGVPEGWMIVRLTSLANVVDGTHDSPKPTSEGYYMVTGKHITNGIIDFSKCYYISPEDHRQVMKRSQPEKGDIIFSNIGTLGSAVLVDQDFEFSIKNVALFKPLKSIYSIYLYTFFSDPRTLNILQSKSSGTSQKFFSLKFLRGIEILIPPSTTLEYFNDVANPLFAQRSLLYREILKLQQARDLLLPRLMNGEITV